MNESKALRLVERYSNHTRHIKELGKKIGESLELCHGVDGDRQKSSQHDTDRNGRDTSTHLYQWYSHENEDHSAGQDIGMWVTVCPHCYSAHLAIQERTEHRKKLGIVRAMITRGGSK